MNIRTVAKKAKVSVATISRVLNHPDSVSSSTKEHVLSVIKELNYTPNWFARGLNLNKTNVIALVVPNILNPVYTQIAKGVEDVAHQKSYNILLCNTEEDEHKEREYIEMFILRKIDGLILTSTLLNKADIEGIKNQGLPLVLIGRSKEIHGENMVYTDFEAGAYEAARHLLELGHSSIAVIIGPRVQYENEEKYRGIEKAFKEIERNLEAKYIFETDNTIEGGYMAARKFMTLDLRPRAIFASSDLMAFGAIEAIKTAGLKIPEDIAVVGYDNVRMSSLVEPKLTTVSQPAHKMGLLSARLLFDIIENKDEAKYIPQEIMLQSKLKIRKSCGHIDRLSEIFD